MNTIFVVKIRIRTTGVDAQTGRRGEGKRDMTITVSESPRLLMPGMADFEPGIERYRVTGGAVTAVLLGAGDRLQVIDPEGCQPVEVAAFDRDGHSDPGLLGDLPHGASGAPATGIAAILASDQHDARRVADALSGKGIDLAAATAVQHEE